MLLAAAHVCGAMASGAGAADRCGAGGEARGDGEPGDGGGDDGHRDALRDDPCACDDAPLDAPAALWWSAASSLPASRFSSTEALVNGGVPARAPTAIAEGGARPRINDSVFGSTEAVINDAGTARLPPERIHEVIASLWHEALSRPLEQRSGRTDDEERRRVSRGECLPFPRSRQIEHERGRHINVVHHTSASVERRCVVVFLPGVRGGVGPCRAGGRDFDEDALFPRLAEGISRAYPVDCHRVSWTSSSPDLDEMVHAVCRVVFYALTAAQTSAHARLVLVGHSFGGAVAFIVARQLGTMIAGTQARIAGVVGLSPQSRGAGEAVAALADTPKLFIHSVDDEVVGFGSALWLHRVAADPKELRLLPTGGHNLEEHKEGLHDELRDWIAAKVGVAGPSDCA